jgi:hypothetical protein
MVSRPMLGGLAMTQPPDPSTKGSPKPLTKRSDDKKHMPVNQATRDEWLETIRNEAGKSIASWVRIGQTLSTAKKSLKRDEFREFRERTGLGPRHACRYRSMGENWAIVSRVEKGTHVSVFPPTSSVMALLSRIPADRLDRAIKDKLVTPKTEKSEAECLIDELAPERRNPARIKNPAKKVVEGLIGAFHKIANFDEAELLALRAHMVKLEFSDNRDAVQGFLDLLSECHKAHADAAE